MNCSKVINSNHAIEFAKSFLHTGFRIDLVSRLQHIEDIETNAEPLRLADVLYNISELLEAMTEAGALAGRGLERDSRFHLWNFSEHTIDRCDNFLETGFFTSAEVRAGMQNKKRKLEFIGAGEFFRKRAN